MPIDAEASRSPAAKGLPSPVSADEAQTNGSEKLNGHGTPSRKAKKTINYLESDSEGTDDDIFKPAPRNRKVNGKPPPNKRRKVSESADEDVYNQDEEQDVDDDGMFQSFYTESGDLT